MSNTAQQNDKQSEAGDAISSEDYKLPLILQSVAEKFHAEYATSNSLSVLVAHQDLLSLFYAGEISPDELKETIHDAKFQAILSAAEASFQKRKDQKIEAGIAKLDKNTHWKIAAAVSLGTGMVTGLVFAVAGPFFSSLLQPTVDELFKRHPAAQAPAQTQPITYTTTNNVYNYYPPDSKPASSQEAKTQENKPTYTLACKNAALGSYNNSLLELLQRGNIVTLEANGKKVSLCYRPSKQSAAQQAQQQTLAK
jgi:hypothetical protein